MINGLSTHTQGAAKAIAYLKDDMYFQEDPTPEEPQRGEWRERDPKPEWIEGDEAKLVALCDSLPFKHTYTTGVLSFTPEESARIDATPGMKEEMIKDLKAFAYAGVKNDDCKPMFINQHTHKQRLELNYFIPRVSLESGKYFNPFPPNYDGRKGKGSNDKFLEQNDAFVDYMCSKYGLQNPRDPKVAREIKITKFDPYKVNKIEIHEAICKSIESGGIKDRDGIISFLEKAGGTITRTGADYISVKFDDNKRAIRLKGEFYGEQSYREISDRIERAAERINRPFEEIESEYKKVLSERAEEVESRHSLKGLAAERADGFDRKSTDELKSYADELSALKDSLGADDKSSDSVNAYIADNNSIVHAADAASGTDCPIEGGVEASLAGPIQTGDPVIDKMSREFHKMQSKLLAEEMQRSKKRWQIDPEQEKRLKEITNWIIKLFTGLSLGRNFFSGSAKPMAPSDIATARQMITQERRELQRELRAVATVIKQRERVEPLQAIMDKPPEPLQPVFEAKAADIDGTTGTTGAVSGGGLETSTADIDQLLGLKRGKDGQVIKPKKPGDDDGSDGTTYG
jgi:hypothetical protein